MCFEVVELDRAAVYRHRGSYDGYLRSKQERLEVLLNALLLTDENAFPVLDDVENNTGLGGLVTRAMLQRVLRIVLETDADTDTDDNNTITTTTIHDLC